MGRPSRLSAIHNGIKYRCYNPKDRGFKNYGARGITVCEEWLDSKRVHTHSRNNPTKGFLAFQKWALANGYADNLTLDRIDNSKGYCPENCRWVTAKVQNNNRRSNLLITYKDRTQTLKQWCDELNLSYAKIFQRLNRLHWSVSEAFELD